ncbi:MAG: phosphoribosylaminoimidazolesuccinocarboxamide synthase [Betaproteobacteria bacterium]|jgi:phosphoribosylaminoimidazole-succinocarboxamide synthase|nr:phosphoribosylaminoimidazolesuccinocarboxamide synthase [Betaproteobacteria bacterium]NBS38477.1 phosphoribosylaminoimidazolesuccinocarboxamide synthase [Betaproteobacteria bacterium]NBT70537.1 phosphoribosylaminoimidazolesuccinocarboxamide synthase [Betaproteobacteria bacterium]NBT80813.1 phosphoribosylaminoimidazolesuccinocarboxamide synthase [Betaproteobacteria bacterium]NBY55172.1 phosphoribosylaminoimidazolesuccinocarboxamide synthase [Betaproteobacteria bacterium]
MSQAPQDRHGLPQALYQSSIRSLPLIGRGKVRDLYAVGDSHLLMITSDRLSAFDVVMGEPIPGKGGVLHEMSLFWFDRLSAIVPNHLTDIDPESVVTADEREQVRDRAVVALRLKPLPVEAVVRGYLIGSGWKDYQRDQAICGVPLPKGLRQASKLAQSIFTPAAKAELGEHDENITYQQVEHLIGAELAAMMRESSLALYEAAAAYAASRGILIADTKFEFGIDTEGRMRLMDEVLTPDSSRYWPADQWREGISPPSFDKQYVRDWLETVPSWQKTAPAPALPVEVIEQTAARYREALVRLRGFE